MTRKRDHRMLVAALVAGCALAFLPATGTAETAKAKWLDEIAVMVNDHQEIAKHEGRERAYDDYLGQIETVRDALTFGNEKGVYVEMNKLMDMLAGDPKGKGIPTWSAKTIFDFCGKVTPHKFHDFERHNVLLTKGGFDYWDDSVFDPGDSG